eukprot:SAG11_NODE_10258_length_843_cov_1.807796_1_plen_141_part_00
MVFVRNGGKTPGPLAGSAVTTKNYGQGGDLEVSRLTLSDRDSVVILDDLLATGGSLESAAKAVEQCGATVDSLFSLAEYRSDFGGRCVGGGRKRLEDQFGRRVVTLLSYESGRLNDWKAVVNTKPPEDASRYDSVASVRS